ncbi:hypothetical protein [Planomonospora parontospora]|uniref:hypothetical protein n=1 Tax=Planomonospora parontospora TaxID=58119 RepID=UPI00166FCF6A|nr:hypothetical protein [Planomonospora parontospora]GGL54809.1 hypothetical protein GCM10014719_65130 [Planomonospora parontospora subsp. antibiotica]GII19276.1 hypothetical protein Ppa05_60020 [Planomonospora parontospora subsp. antibiotica]
MSAGRFTSTAPYYRVFRPGIPAGAVAALTAEADRLGPARRLLDLGTGTGQVPAALHAAFYRLDARNRVWLAYRRLPVLLIPVYLTAWTVLSVARIRSRATLAVWLAGLREGLKGGHGHRRPMSWTTVLRLTRAGLPPIV